MFNRINILIPVLGSRTWTGGFTYQSNLIEALRARMDTSIFLIGYFDNPVSDSQEKTWFSAINNLYRRIEYKLSMWLLGYDIRLSRKVRLFATGQYNALFTHNNYHLKIKANLLKLYWIPDFQHLHLSYLFTQQELEERSRRYLDGCRYADIVFLSSKNAQHDLESFAPQYLSKSRISNFVANVPERLWTLDPNSLCSKYQLPEKFFYLPNQFWKHKNHVVVFEALKLLQSEGIAPVIVCTGNPTDYRNPDYFRQLKEKLVELGIDGQVHILGLVDHDDVLLLIRQCVALINPSLFEGWSTTVEECKSIGKRTILSDIEVHREQQPPNSRYFPPHDAEALSIVLREVWEESPPGPDPVMEQAARNDLRKRMSNYAENFIQILKSANNKPEREHQRF